MRGFSCVLAICCGLVPETTHAQSFDVTGTRPAGMGGAFVGVADDATALYWNPAGLASGAYFSLAVDGTQTSAVPDEGPRGRKQSSYFLGLTTPALGLSYYRLRTASAVPDDLLVPIDGAGSDRNLTGAPFVRLETLVTHHAGVTLVQSIVPSVAVGSTLKLVRGIASTEVTGSGSARDAFDADPRGHGTTRFDMDIGVMASFRRVKAGLTLRNVREPEFHSPEGGTLRLERQARAGLSFALLSNWLVAADLDLLTQKDAFGRRRDVAVGAEGRLARRMTVRSGVRFNIAENGERQQEGTRGALTFGASFAAKASLLLDAVAIAGGDRSGRGWGLAARFLY